MQIKFQIILLLSLCAYAKNPKVSTLTTEVESGNASPTKTRVKQNVLYTHACESNYMAYSTIGLPNRRNQFKELADMMCIMYDFALYKYIEIYKEAKLKSKECEDATAQKHSDNLYFRLLTNRVESQKYKIQLRSTKKKLKLSLEKAEESYKKAVEKCEELCSDYEEFEDEMEYPLKEFKKEEQVASERTNRFLRVCMNDVGNCEEERESMRAWMDEIRANAKREKEEEEEEDNDESEHVDESKHGDESEHVDALEHVNESKHDDRSEHGDALEHVDASKHGNESEHVDALEHGDMSEHVDESKHDDELEHSDTLEHDDTLEYDDKSEHGDTLEHDDASEQHEDIQEQSGWMARVRKAQ
ncbi:hypothetical protein BASA60_001757 [Batrachochytrium salamandrivorans]|nr:hypothetical protein BASA60_001757 [Batrachochytrium salamandrivorans]